MTYKYPGGDSIGERYQSGRWWRINVENEPESALPQSGAPRNSIELDASFPIVDCSNTDYICARTYERVFAVPRHGIQAGKAFNVQGAEITIEGCITSGGEECTTALFISDCRKVDGLGVASVPPGKIVGESCRQGAWGQRAMFVYDIERGVIAFESADWWKAGTDISHWDLSTLGVSAGLMTLVETKGLLTCRISSVA